MNASTAPPVAQQVTRERPHLLATPIPFAELAGFGLDDHLEAFRVFARSCAAIAAKSPPLRGAASASAALERIARKALCEELGDGTQARRFFEGHFRPCRVSGDRGETGSAGFLTGYYEPIVDGSLARTPEFTAPILALPAKDATPAPYPGREAIEAGAIDGVAAPLVWLRDHVEVFLVHVQGSARVRLVDGRVLRLVYAGRNGHPYTSIGRILIEDGDLAETDMSLAALKQWIRSRGQNPGDGGLALMHRNKSYVFFALEQECEKASGPTGGQGIALTALRSVAVDRTTWSYGLPFWIAADLPWRSSVPSPFQRLMIAQDTGSAIVGPARCDIFFGSGDDAGTRAGDIRHAGEVIVLLPADQVPDS
ncbi:MAG: MltA domain-containing protein [Beijerinckiaceae bacterium]|nr:MltA domain-containing protein [Beijerinckiaceae bacterium]